MMAKLLKTLKYKVTNVLAFTGAGPMPTIRYNCFILDQSERSCLSELFIDCGTNIGQERPILVPKNIKLRKLLFSGYLHSYVQRIKDNCSISCFCLAIAPLWLFRSHVEYE